MTRNHKNGGSLKIIPFGTVLLITFFVVFLGLSVKSEHLLNNFGTSLHNGFGINFGAIGNVIYIVLSVFSTFFLFLISYCVVRMYEVRKKEHEHLQHEIAEYAHHQAEKERKLKEGQNSSKNDVWNSALRHLLSSNPAEWKLAILEADEMLDDLLDQLGFKGENLGEKLKTVDREKFPALNPAWEVHLVRNRIAHEGSGFELSDHETKRIIALYEKIFRGFNYI